MWEMEVPITFFDASSRRHNRYQNISTSKREGEGLPSIDCIWTDLFFRLSNKELQQSSCVSLPFLRHAAVL